MVSRCYIGAVLERLDRFRWDLVVLGAIGVAYVATANHHLAGNDNGEFLVIFCEGGIAHPPGYPLFSALLRATSWFPGDTVAHAASLVNALIGWLSVVVLYHAARRWEVSRTGALIGACFFGLSTEIWLVHTYAEAFALNHLVAAGIFYFAAPIARFRGAWRLVALGALGGLGLAHHHASVFLAPVGFYGLWLGTREVDRPFAGLGLSGLALAAALAVPQAYFLLADGCADCMKWGQFETIGDVVHHFVRGDYGTGQLTVDGEYRPVEQITHWLVEVSADLGFVGFGIAIVGVFRTLASSDRRRWGVVVAALVLSGPFFAALFNSELDLLTQEVIKRHHALSELVACVMIAAGYDALRRDYHDRPKIVRGLAVVAVVTLLGMTVRGWYVTDRHHTEHIERYLVRALDAADRRGIVFGTGDHRMFGTQYVQRCLDRNASVEYVDAELLGHAWYRRRVADRLGVEPPTPVTDGEQWTYPIVTLFERLLSHTDRPVYLMDEFTPKLAERFSTHPHGPLTRVLPPGESAPSAAELVRTNRSIYERYSGPSARPDPKINPWAFELVRRHGWQWKRLEQMCDPESKCGADAREMRRIWELDEPD